VVLAAVVQHHRSGHLSFRPAPCGVRNRRSSEPPTPGAGVGSKAGRDPDAVCTVIGQLLDPATQILGIGWVMMLPKAVYGSSSRLPYVNTVRALAAGWPGSDSQHDGRDQLASWVPVRCGLTSYYIVILQTILRTTRTSLVKLLPGAFVASSGSDYGVSPEISTVQNAYYRTVYVLVVRCIVTLTAPCQEC
jgi:hypothetical protein